MGAPRRARRIRYSSALGAPLYRMRHLQQCTLEITAARCARSCKAYSSARDAPRSREQREHLETDSRLRRARAPRVSFASMYSPDAQHLRRCTATTRAGKPCRAWAIWGHPQQVCATHAGRTAVPNHPQRRRRTQRANYPSCRCQAYPHPHRPGAGACTWPNTPRGSHLPTGQRWTKSTQRRCKGTDSRTSA